MNISKVSAGVSGKDLMGMYSEFVNIKEVTIERIDITDEVIIIGEFKKGFIISFEGRFKLNSVDGDNISAEVSRFKILNIGVASFFRKIALKFALKSFKEKGITYDSGKVIVNYKYLLKDVPYVDLDIEKINIEDGIFKVDVKNVQISINGALKKDVTLFEEKEADETINTDDVSNKIEDGYTHGRDIIKDKLPIKVNKYSDYIFVLPDIAALIYRLLKDKRVSMKTKIIIAGAVSYIAVPSDVIPDKIPFIGKIDDIAIGVFALNVILNDVPLNIVLENWQGKNDIILVLRSIVEYATNFTGAKNIETICNVIEEIVTV